jgi:uncharacterized membrane protein
MLHPSTHVGVAIARPVDAVYAFAADGANLPRWAAGLASGAVRRDGEDWLADSPMGPIRIRFADPNPYGVLDHRVTLPNGETQLNPMRVVPNGDGAELTFTLFRLPGVTDAAFAADAAQVEADLRRLKELLETDGGGRAAAG